MSGGVMKALLILLAASCIIGFVLNTYAIDVVECQCGYKAGGECVPCNEGPIEDKIDNSNKKDKPIKDTICPCGYDPDGVCVPCRESNDNTQKKENY